MDNTPGKMTPNYSKLFGCNVHGSIRVGPMALKIINTPEFQRMRNIKQLGLCHYVYPAATHTRFEHSIGVYHLAGLVTEKIRLLCPGKIFHIPELGGETELTPEVAECIKIGALCHDIGHGPFSHIFDNLLKNSNHPNKEHEVRSCLIAEKLCRRELPGELNNGHIEFIKSIIDPQKHHRGAIYQIVANNLNGVDVDKFDYLMRDTKTLNLGSTFNPMRLINELIIDENNNIAYPKHCSLDIYEMFQSRYMMHKKVYSHKTVTLIEVMLSDIFTKIDPIFKIADSINDMDKFCRLTDDTIFYYMQTIISPPVFCRVSMADQNFRAVLEANEIYQRIVSRNLYQQVAETVGDAVEEMQNFIDYFTFKFKHAGPENFQVVKTKIGFVGEHKPDPFYSIYFYDKKEHNESFTLSKSHISALINSNDIRETHTHLVCRDRTLYPLALGEFKMFLSSGMETRSAKKRQTATKPNGPRQ